MTKPKEKFLFDDDLLEEMHRKKEIENKILKPILMWAIFYPDGSMTSYSIKETPRESWEAAFHLNPDYKRGIENLKSEGYQCRQIKIEALKK